MKRKAGRVWIAAFLAAVLLLGGCSADGNTKSTSDAGSAVESGIDETNIKSGEQSLAETANENSQETSSEMREDVVIRLAALKGPTSMGMVKLLEDASKGESQEVYDFTLAASPDEIIPKIIKGEVDIAAVPSNMASVLYNKTEGKVKVLALNTLGVLYICTRGNVEINSVEDLKGKTIYAGGKGATPEYVLSYILAQHGLDIEKDVKVEWKSEHAEIISALANEEEGIALLPQPFVTVAAAQIEDLHSALDLTKEWDSLDNGSRLITGVLVGRTEFIDQNKENLDRFLEEYKASTEWVNAEVEESAALIEKYDIIKAAVAQKALPYCNITYIEGEDMEKALSGYLDILFSLKAESVGGKLPEADFYYKR